MPFFISSKVFKQQTKALVKNWPFAGITTAHVRNVLSQLYGYKNTHHYQKAIAGGGSEVLTPCTKESVITHYKLWVKKLAQLGPMNEIQAKNVLHTIWPAYLTGEIDPAQKLYQCQFRFIGECTDFLAEDIRDTSIEYAFDDRPSVKDAIEAIGVPHPEVGAIQVGSQYVDFNYLLKENEQVTVYSSSVRSVETYLPYMPEGELSFLLDVHLGGLARYLRMAGFDCMFENKDYGDALLAEVAASENYILLTRDIGLLKRGKVKYARWIRNVSPESQFKEVVEHYQLNNLFKPLSRCVKCNGNIKEVKKEWVKDTVPVGVYEWVEEFRQCDECSQVYWKGTHFEKIQDILAKAKG